MAFRLGERTDEPTTGRRAKTLQERFGFVDGDLTSSGHDALMLWLSEPIDDTGLSRAADAARCIFAKKENRLPRTIEGEKNDWLRFMEEWNGEQQRARETPAPDPPSPINDLRIKQRQLVWEKPVMSGSYTVGFVDLFVELIVERLELLWRDNAWTWRRDSSLAGFCFEVKTRIPSLGELVRQVRLYQTYERDATFVVVAPDDRFRSALESQGIGFVLAQPEDE